jgi:HEAT repeat protein
MIAGRTNRLTVTRKIERMCSRAVTATAALVVVLASAGTLFAESPEQQAWGMLRSGIQEKNSGTRTQAVHALGLLPHDPEATEMVEAALKDPDQEVRVAAATALGEMGAKEAIPMLKKSLSDPKPGVVLVAARSLRLLDDPSGSEFFGELLVGERKPEGRVSQEMDTLNTKRVVEFGVEYGLGFLPFAHTGYSALKAVRKDAASTSRALAARELAKDANPRFNHALVQAATSDKSWLVRSSALLAIAKRENPEVLTAIIPALSDQNQAVRFTAAAAVIKLAKIATPIKDGKDTGEVPSDKSKY